MGDAGVRTGAVVETFEVTIRGVVVDVLAEITGPAQKLARGLRMLYWR